MHWDCVRQLESRGVAWLQCKVVNGSGVSCDEGGWRVFGGYAKTSTFAKVTS